MLQRTIFLGRLLGLYCLIAGLAMFLRGAEIADTVALLVQDMALMFLIGIMTLLAGLAMVLTHNIWTGGILPVCVTLIGWLSLLKGASFLLLSQEANARFVLETLQYQTNFYYFAALSVLIGLCLTYAGFRKT